MSWYTIFDEQESLLTSSTTTVLGSTDVVLVHSYVDGRKHQVPVAVVGSGGTATISSCLTTATAIPNVGITLLKSTAGSSAAWTLTDPTAAGQVKTLAFVSSTTSTMFSVTTVAASIQSSAGFSGTFVNFGSTQTGAMVNAGNAVTMVSLSSTAWQVIGSNRIASSVTSGLVIAANDGPLFS